MNFNKFYFKKQWHLIALIISNLVQFVALALIELLQELPTVSILS